jgi:hypothetical protein
MVYADDPRALYIGRIDTSDPAGPQLIESATSVTLHFVGAGVAIELNDAPFAGDSVDFFDVSFDGAAPFVLALSPGPNWYELSPEADGGGSNALGCGDHTVTLVKRTETTVGTTQVLGFRLAGGQAPVAPAAVHRIEIVGDSLACGYGVEAASPDAAACADNGVGSPGYGQGVENGTKAFGVVMATALGAEWHLTCESGVGLVRNTDNGFIDPRPMPLIYGQLHTESTTNLAAWPPTQWGEHGGAPVVATPDVVVVELGGNDLSVSTADGGMRPPIPVGSPTDGPDAGPGLARGFVEFVGQLAADFPGAAIVLIANATEVESAIDAVVAYFGDGGAGAAPGLRVLGFADGLPYPGDGCAGHPNVAQQAAAGARLAAYVRSAMGW